MMSRLLLHPTRLATDDSNQTHGPPSGLIQPPSPSGSIIHPPRQHHNLRPAVLPDRYRHRLSTMPQAPWPSMLRAPVRPSGVDHPSMCGGKLPNHNTNRDHDRCLRNHLPPGMRHRVCHGHPGMHLSGGNLGSSQGQGGSVKWFGEA